MKLKVNKISRTESKRVLKGPYSIWTTKRLKDLGFLQNGVSSDAEYFGSGFPFVSYGNVYNNKLEVKDVKTFAKSTKQDQKLYSVKEGDVFFTRTSETISEIGISATCQKTIPTAVFSGFVIRFRQKGCYLYSGFSKYYFNAASHRNFFGREMNIVTRTSLSQGILSNLPVLIPELQEQVAIEGYLDAKVIKINNKIQLLKDKKEKLKEYKQALICETVTKGLLSTSKLQSSGIDFIGNVPSEWEILRGKDVFSYLKKINKGFRSKNVLSLTYGGVINKDFDTTAGLNPQSYETYQVVEKDNLMFKLIDLENIKTSRVGIVHENGIMSSAYIRLKANPGISSKYYYYLYYYYYKINLFNYLGGGVRSTLNYSSLLEIPVIKPSFEEQQAIVKYLDANLYKVDSVIENIEATISLLSEYQKTLINEVVIGKLRIT